MSKLPTWTLEFFGRRVTIPYIVDCREIKAVVTMTDAAGNSGEVVFTADGPVAPEEPVMCYADGRKEPCQP